jgi:hypothetical protein
VKVRLPDDDTTPAIPVKTVTRFEVVSDASQCVAISVLPRWANHIGYYVDNAGAWDLSTSAAVNLYTELDDFVYSMRCISMGAEFVPICALDESGGYYGIGNTVDTIQAEQRVNTINSWSRYHSLHDGPQRAIWKQDSLSPEWMAYNATWSADTQEHQIIFDFRGVKASTMIGVIVVTAHWEGQLKASQRKLLSAEACPPDGRVLARAGKIHSAPPMILDNYHNTKNDGWAQWLRDESLTGAKWLWDNVGKPGLQAAVQSRFAAPGALPMISAPEAPLLLGPALAF